MFLFSNLSLFVLLPFAYLFTESEGFFGHRKGLMSRVYETFIVLFLLGMVVLGMTYVISALIDENRSGFQTLLSKSKMPFLTPCFITYYFQIFGVTTCHSCILAYHFLVSLCYSVCLSNIICNSYMLTF